MVATRPGLGSPLLPARCIHMLSCRSHDTARQALHCPLVHTSPVPNFSLGWVPGLGVPPLRFPLHQSHCVLITAPVTIPTTDRDPRGRPPASSGCVQSLTKAWRFSECRKQLPRGTSCLAQFFVIPQGESHDCSYRYGWILRLKEANLPRIQVRSQNQTHELPRVLGA